MKIHTNSFKSIIFVVEILLCFFFSLVSLNCVAADYKEIDFKTYSTIRNGINIIHLPAGVFFISKTIRLTSNTVLEGEGDNTILRAVRPFTGPRFISNSDYRRGNVNIALRSLKIEFELPVLEGDGIGVLRFENVDTLQIQDITMTVNSAMYGIDLASNIRRGLVERCTIVNHGQGGGIMVRNRNPNPSKASDNIIIRNNQLKSSIVDEPLAVFGWLGVVQNVLIEKNNVQALGASFGITVFGIGSPKHTGQINDVQIIDNEISGGKHSAIGVKGGARDVYVAHNLISDSTGDGVFIHAGGDGLPSVQDIKVYQNAITNIGRHGILSTGINIKVEKNVISNCKRSGIYVAGQIAVVGNKIDNANPGILVDGSPLSIIRKNILRNARILTLPYR